MNQTRHEMTLPDLITQRFIPEHGFRIALQVPQTHTQIILDTIMQITSFKYGDYDQVSFTTSVGTQQFRSLGSGRNAPTQSVVSVPCVELSVFVEKDDTLLARVIDAVYNAHPYEEPVIFITNCLRTQHIRGLDEDNPNRFWNTSALNWVPSEHR
jgi:hypothetical protein